MPEPLHAVPPAAWDTPEHWSDSARDAFLEVVEVRPDLSGADLAALEQAASLIDTADRLDEVARAAGMSAIGSAGQDVLHPAVPEARQARAAAARILARLSTPAKSSLMSNSERGRLAARARWNKPGAGA